MNKLLILAPDADEYDRLIRAAGLPQLEIVTAVDADSGVGLAPECNIMLGEPALIVAALPFASRLKWVQSSWAGVDSLCSRAQRRDYTLTGVKDVFGPMISEYVMAYLFALERRLFDMRANQAGKRWQPLPYRQCGDITLGIAGLGSIGRHLVKTGRHFGFQVTGLNRTGQPVAGLRRVFTPDNLAGFLAAADYLVVTLPDTPQTRHFINADALRMMKPSAVLINVGRGGTVNEADLARALRRDDIAGAVLDVFAAEPLPADNPLWEMPQVYITPHSAARSFPDKIAEIFIANFRRFVRGEPLQYVVDFERGY